MSELLTHGGDWAGFLSERGKLPLDFSASISPLGVPGACVRLSGRQRGRWTGIRTLSAGHCGSPFPSMSLCRPSRSCAEMGRRS